MGISVVLLAYKEAENLKVLLPQIQRQVEQCGEEYEILVIDTIEPLDNTQEVCKEFGAKYYNQEEPNFAGAFRTGIKYAGMDRFLIMDSDGSHNPKYIPDIYRVFTAGADVAIGSRYVKGGVTGDSYSSRAMSWILNTMFRLCLGIRAKDISTDFRMYHTESLKKVTLTCQNYDVLQEVLLKLKMNNPDLVIAETPITFDKRLFGDSKRRLIPFIVSYIKTLLRLTTMHLNSPVGRNLLRQIILYGVIGLLAAAVDFSIFSLVNRLSFTTSPVLANMAGSLVGFFFSFSLNTFFTFRKNDKLLRRFLSYFTICLAGMLLSSSIIYLLQNTFNLSGLKLFCIMIVSIIQFVLNKFITFRS